MCIITIKILITVDYGHIYIHMYICLARCFKGGISSYSQYSSVPRSLWIVCSETSLRSQSQQVCMVWSLQHQADRQQSKETFRRNLQKRPNIVLSVAYGPCIPGQQAADLRRCSPSHLAGTRYLLKCGPHSGPKTWHRVSVKNKVQDNDTSTTFESGLSPWRPGLRPVPS